MSGQNLAVDFSLSLAMCPPERLLPMARLAEECGWDSIAVPDSVFFPEKVSGDYPFTADGARFWPAETPFVEPLVSIPAMAAATERIRFLTSVMKTPLREPLLVAKAVGSIAAMFPGRVDLGVGLSWIPEEFEWLGQEMRTRGRRLDEQIDIFRLAFAGGWFEFHGRHHDFDRIRMEPSPSRPVPILVGGHSDAAMRRAVERGDGWIGAQLDRAGIGEALGRLDGVLDASEGSPAGFQKVVTPLVPPRPEAFLDLAEAGITGIVTMPWYFMPGDPSDPTHQDDSIAWFAETVIEPVRKDLS
ncbi:MAG: TIGR03619 family F420-dependent LLM class oxidoreductase [Acidimicrobiales bacterium]|nr:TIGR03619 family F420-dependent LLM class oxidoreductase [Acidimicrobiales bacterium]